MATEIQVRTIPLAMRNPTTEGKVPEKIGLKEISSGDEEEAAETAKSAAQLPYRFLRKAMMWIKYEGDPQGRTIKRENAEEELIFNSLTIQSRGLLIQFLNEMSTPKP